MAEAHGSPFLTLHRVQPATGWDTRLIEAAQRLGYEHRVKGRLWRRCAEKSVGSGVRYADGLRITPIRLGRRYQALAITPHRYFFEGDRDTPARKPFSELCSGSDLPPPRSSADAISELRDVLLRLPECYPELSPVAVPIADQLFGLSRQTSYVAGAGGRLPLSTSPGKLLSGPGPLDKPAQLDLRILQGGAEDSASKRYASYLVDAFGRCGIAATAEQVDYSASVPQRTGGKAGRPTVTLVATDGHRGDPLPPEVGQSLAKLDAVGIPYRLFSRQNRSPKWASFDQISILLQCAGLRPYELVLPEVEGLSNPVFIGLDLGHPRTGKCSHVVLSIVDCKGRLRGYWKGSQPRDETLKHETLERALTWTYMQLRKEFAGEYQAVIMRDGRMFENEALTVYEGFFGHDFTLVEVTKNPVPLMLCSGRCADAGTACVLESSPYAFVLTSRGRVKSQINLPLKLNIAHDGLRIRMKNVCALVTGLCYAPTLGLNATRTPAPIYWSNGIAAISETNHQFSGLHHVPHN